MLNEERKEISLTHLSSEYKYLSDLTITRTRDANTFWISSIATIGAFLSISIKFENWIPILLIFYILPPFIYGISWQLDAILRIRTYIITFIDPELKGGWSFAWNMHPIRVRRYSHHLYTIPAIYSLIYIVIIIFILLISNKYFPYGKIEFIGIFICPIILVILSMVYMFKMFSLKLAKEYMDGWKMAKINFIFK